MNSVKKNSIGVAVLVLIVLVGGFFAFNKSQMPKTQANIANTVSETQVKSTISVQIKADSQTKDYQVKGAVGKTALEVTKEATSNVKMTGEGENAFITVIDGREASSDKKEFWKLVINGKDSQVGAGSYTVKENDKISWEIATY